MNSKENKISNMRNAEEKELNQNQTDQMKETITQYGDYYKSGGNPDKTPRIR